MKIVFINPLMFFPAAITQKEIDNNAVYCVPPLGLLYVAAYVNKTLKVDINVLDYNFEFLKYAKMHGLEKALKNCTLELCLNGDFNFDVACIAAPFSIFKDNVFSIADAIKKNNAQTITVVGGAFPTFQPEKCLDAKNIDFIILGEGEVACHNLLEYLSKDVDIRMPQHNFKLPGCGYIKNGEKIIHYSHKYIEDLDALPYPLFGEIDLLDYNKYGRYNTIPKYMHLPTANLAATRGCPSRCIFCGVPRFFGRKIRYRSTDNVFNEILYLKNKYGIRHFIFTDSNLTTSRSFAKGLTKKIIDERLDIKWCSPDGIAIWTLDEELIELMVESGCYSIALGIESGDEAVLKNVLKKPLSLSIVKEKIKILLKYRRDIYITGLFMLGIPYETKTQMRKTIMLAKELELDWNEFAVTLPYPNTELWEICIKEGYIDEKEDDIDKLAYMNSFIKTPEFNVSEVRDIAYDANIEINFLNNPNYIKYDIDKAIDDFQKVFNRYPEHSVAAYMLCEAYRKKGKFSDAERIKSELYKLLLENEKSRGLFNRYNLSIQNAVAYK